MLVSSVAPGWPAHAAGIKQGDVFLEVDGKAITDIPALKNIISHGSAGRSISAKIIPERANKRIQDHSSARALVLPRLIIKGQEAGRHD